MSILRFGLVHWWRKERTRQMLRRQQFIMSQHGNEVRRKIQLFVKRHCKKDKGNKTTRKRQLTDHSQMRVKVQRLTLE